MLVEELISPSEFDRRGTAMKYPNVYANPGIGRKVTTSIKTITIRDSKTGKVYGRRSIHSK